MGDKKFSSFVPVLVFVKTSFTSSKRKVLAVFAVFAVLFQQMFNPIQDGRVGGGGGKKDPLTSFSAVTSTNVRIGP